MRTKLFIVFAGVILISGAVGNRFLERTVRKTSEANAEQTLLLSARAVASVAATVPKAQWAQRAWEHPMPPSPVSLALFGADGLRVAVQEPFALNEETRRSENITSALEGR